MSARLYVRGGSGLGGGTEIPHIAEITDFAPSFEGKQPLIELGMSFANGAASQGTFVTNPTLMFGTPGGVFAPHAQVTWTEDASGDELWLAQGRTSGEEEGRGIPLAEDIVEHVVTVDDANVDTRGLAFTEDWVRPAETGTDRLYALDAYILSAGSSTSPTLRYSTDITISDAHLAPDTNTVTMPAKTYPAGTQPSEVINDCAETEGKVWGVVIHHVAGVSHLCLLYIQELDHSTFASPCKISDQVANWDPTDLTAPVFEPIWDQGKGLLYGGQTAVSGILSRYGQEDQFVYVNNPTLEDQNEHWIESFSDADSVNATQAEARANSVLSYRQFGDFTYRATVVVLPEQFHLLGAGMSIQADTAVFPGGTFRGSYEDVRIIQLSWEPMPDGRYKAHMQLNRAPRTLAPSKGKPIPTEAAPVCQPDEVVSPTLVWAADYTTNDNDTTNTYDFGLDRVAHGTGGTPAAEAFFSTSYGRNSGSAYASAKLPWTASNDCAFSADMLWHFTPSNRNVDLYWFNVSDALLRVDRVVSGAGRATDVGYPGVGAVVTPPATSTSVQIYWTNFAGLYADNVELSIPGSTVAADNSDFCVADPGDSPYFMRSDDPRVLDLIERADTVGYSWKMPVRVATTAAGTLATSFENGDTIDGVVLAAGDRILIKNQAAGADNGIYTVNATGAPTRATDFDTDLRAHGAATFVSEGTANGNKIFLMTTNAPIDLGTTTLTFAELSSSSALIVQEDDSTVDAAVTTLDFTTALNVTSSPSGEANIAVDLGTGATQAAAGNHTHATIGGGALSSTIIYRATDQNVDGSDTATDVSFSNEVEDTHGCWAIGTPTKIIIPAALNGRRAIVYGQVKWSASTAGGHRQVYIDKGGTAIAETHVPDHVAAYSVTEQVQTKVLTLATGDEYKLVFRTDTTGIGALGGEHNTFFGLRTVDPGLGEWTAYTPTITASGGGFNIGSSSIKGRYKALDSKTYFVQITLVVTTGGAWNAGTGTWSVSLPAGLTARTETNWEQMIPAHVLDSGTTNFVCMGKIASGGTTIYETNVADAANPRNLSNSVPVTWATGDQVHYSGIVEVD